VILGFGKGKEPEKKERTVAAPVESDEFQHVLFQGPLSGEKIDLAKNARLTEVGLVKTKELVSDALARRAEMIRIDPKGKATVVTLVVDGVSYSGGRLPTQQGLAVTQMLKLLAGLQPGLRTKAQSGGLNSEYSGTPYELLVETSPQSGGAERVLVRVRNPNEKLESPDDIGFTEPFKLRVRDLATQGKGVLLACGPPRSGTSTAMMAVVRSIDPYLYALYSIADGIELDYIAKLDHDPGDDLETKINRAKRMEANVLLLNPIQDAATAKSIFSFYEQLSMVSEFVAKDAAHGVLQLQEWLEDPKLLSVGLQALVCPRLLRLLCDECKQAFRPNAKLLARVGLPPETKVLYRAMPAKGEKQQAAEDPEPCNACGGIGFKGRTGVFELLDMTDAMRQLVASSPTAQAIKAQARKEEMPSFQQNALLLVAKGQTSLEEVQRVFKSS